MRDTTLNCIVLVKQVPDVSRIPEDAWDREKGTLRRAVLDSILNPLDLHALTLAGQITGAMPGAKTVYLTMGPRQAREMLIECISRVPGEAILLTDKGFAGADTVATSYSLACAIRRVQEEVFGGSGDYLIVAGMQSVDGDTAQVPPQIAEELGIELVAYAEAVSVEPGQGTGLAFRRIGPGGTELVRPRALPALVTVTASTEPVYRSFELARKARNAAIQEWSAASVGADPERIGLKGSRTNVHRIFSPSDERQKTCRFVSEPAELAGAIAARFSSPVRASGAAAKAVYDLNGRTPSYNGEIWAFAESDNGAIRQVAFELLGRARELAGPLGERVGAVLPCDPGSADAAKMAAELIAHGADVVYSLEHPLLGEFNPVAFKKAVSTLVLEKRPQIMLFGATPLGRELAPRVAYASVSGLTADCTELGLGDNDKGGRELVAALLQTRPALGGNIMATIVTKDSETQMATVRPGVFKLPVRAASRTGEVVHITPRLGESDAAIRTLLAPPSEVHGSIAEAEVIVSGGHAFRSKAHFEDQLGLLAAALGKRLDREVAIGASRMAVEAGYTTHEHQVGQTGTTVAPRLYIAIGISGAIQHISGMQQSEIVVAINKDPRAPIFGHADFGIVGEIDAVLPELARALESGSPPVAAVGAAGGVA